MIEKASPSSLIATKWPTWIRPAHTPSHIGEVFAHETVRAVVCERESSHFPEDIRCIDTLTQGLPLASFNSGYKDRTPGKVDVVKWAGETRDALLFIAKMKSFALDEKTKVVRFMELAGHDLKEVADGFERAGYFLESIFRSPNIFSYPKELNGADWHQDSTDPDKEAEKIMVVIAYGSATNYRDRECVIVPDDNAICAHREFGVDHRRGLASRAKPRFGLVARFRKRT